MIKDPIQFNQMKIAKKTLKMNSVMVNLMGGMTIEEAKTFLKSIGYTDKQIEKLSK